MAGRACPRANRGVEGISICRAMSITAALLVRWTVAQQLSSQLSQLAANEVQQNVKGSLSWICSEYYQQYIEQCMPVQQVEWGQGVGGVGGARRACLGRKVIPLSITAQHCHTGQHGCFLLAMVKVDGQVVVTPVNTASQTADPLAYALLRASAYKIALCRWHLQTNSQDAIP